MIKLSAGGGGAAGQGQGSVQGLASVGGKLQVPSSSVGNLSSSLLGGSDKRGATAVTTTAANTSTSLSSTLSSSFLGLSSSSRVPALGALAPLSASSRAAEPVSAVSAVAGSGKSLAPLSSHSLGGRLSASMALTSDSLANASLPVARLSQSQPTRVFEDHSTDDDDDDDDEEEEEEDEEEEDDVNGSQARSGSIEIEVDDDDDRNGGSAGVNFGNLDDLPDD